MKIECKNIKSITAQGVTFAGDLSATITIELESVENKKELFESLLEDGYTDKSLEEQNKIMREALEFYASFWSWDNRNELDGDCCVVDDCSEEPVEYSDGRIYQEYFGGKLAREALKKIEEMK